MQINWYPGHMAKSIRAIKETVALADVLVYVLDARAPRSCINPDFAPFIARLPVVYVLNKADLADETETAKWKRALSNGENRAISLCGTVSGATSTLLAAIMRAGERKRAKYASKGAKVTVKTIVLGVPNTGKSTIINNMIGKSRAATANRAGVTRGQQWFKAGGDIEMMDTPGTLYPKLENQSAARHLAYIGSIRDEVVDAFELSKDLLSELGSIAPGAIHARYGITPAGDPEADLVSLARARGFLLRGGEPDLERAAAALIDDFRKGKLGKITLDGADENS